MSRKNFRRNVKKLLESHSRTILWKNFILSHQFEKTTVFLRGFINLKAKIHSCETHMVDFRFTILIFWSGFEKKSILWISKADSAFGMTISNLSFWKLFWSFLSFSSKNEGLVLQHRQPDQLPKFLRKMILLSKSSNNFRSKQLLTSTLITAMPLMRVYLIIIFFTFLSCLPAIQVSPR